MVCGLRYAGRLLPNLAQQQSEQTVFIDHYLDAVADNASRSGIDRKPFGPTQVGKGELDPSIWMQQNVPREDHAILDASRGNHAVTRSAQSGLGQPIGVVLPSLFSRREN